jgi:hypothetical protein
MTAYRRPADVLILHAPTGAHLAVQHPAEAGFCIPSDQQPPNLPGDML